MTATSTELERDLWRSFFVMRRQLELTLERRLQADAGISTADFEILMSLLDEPAQQLRAGQIGDIIGWEKSRVSHQITRMEQRGLVTRRECGDDARGVWVVLTEEGSRAVLSAGSDRRDAVRQYFFDVLTDDEKQTMLEVSRKVLDTIDPPICNDVKATV
jgi:DNA-binding MarR family transcriptional regulator